MSQEGNYVGTVSFDDTIIYSQDMMPVDAPEDKDVISGAIKEHSATNGDTDIGAAMEQAVNMLKSDGNPDLPSTIILLTDGNTDLDNDPGAVSEEEEASVEKKSAAIASAREAGIPVYSVCLNENGEADFSETKQISDATGGQAQEVTDAADLTNVYEMFYRLIYGTGTTCILDGIVPVDATYTVSGYRGGGSQRHDRGSCDGYPVYRPFRQSVHGYSDNTGRKYYSGKDRGSGGRGVDGFGGRRSRSEGKDQSAV